MEYMYEGAIVKLTTLYVRIHDMLNFLKNVIINNYRSFFLNFLFTYSMSFISCILIPIHFPTPSHSPSTPSHSPSTLQNPPIIQNLREKGEI